ncbi:hypothetical protein [Ruminococcus flavefaciens]|uniref:hypothetical protein n=1 Tax=Ruminococcus flavefaciens TaxID=1265 RepID=UPI0004669753|nr:hypothetical protein [Ruminococcus flavefaciens]
MLLSAIIPVICFGAAFAADTLLEKKFGSDKKFADTAGKFRKKLIGAACLLLCIFLLLHAITASNMINGESGLSAAAMTVSSLLAFGALLAGRYSDEKLGKLLNTGALCALILLTAEVFIFNGKSFGTVYVNEELLPSNMEITGSAGATADEEITVECGNSKLTINDLPDDINDIEMEFDAEEPIPPFDVKLSITDDNLSLREYTLQHKRISGQDTKLSMSFKPYKTLRSLRINIDGVGGKMTIRNIRVLSKPAYAFSDIRFFSLLTLVMLLAAIKIYRFCEVTYDNRKNSHIIAVAAMMLLVIFTGYFFSAPDQTPREYASDADYLDDPYASTLQAFLNGQVYLNAKVAPELENLDNVYDDSERSDKGVDFLWDYAYYKGHYYCYFGAAPVITFYYPYYKVTGYVPTMAMANNFFIIMGLMFMCLTVLAAIKLLKLKPNLLLLLLIMPTAAATIGIWFTANCIDRYTVPSATGLCYIMLCLSAGMTAITTKNKKLKPLLLFFSGAALALCVASRPTIALCAAILVPYFWRILFDKKEKLPWRIALAASFLIPLMTGAVLIMKYNAARFDSPFQFGAIYQLTVSNAGANKLSLARIPDAVIHYFIHPPKLRSSFPFIETAPVYLENYPAYTYISSGCGALMFPVLMFGAFMLPYAFGKKSKELPDRSRRQLIWICLAVSFITAWLDMSLGGIVTHYLFDFTPLLFIVAMLGIFRGCSKPHENKGRYILAGVSMAATIVFTLALCLDINGSSMIQHCPAVLDRAEDLIIFWQ